MFLAINEFGDCDAEGQLVVELLVRGEQTLAADGQLLARTIWSIAFVESLVPESCANYLNSDGEALVVPDVIVHIREGMTGQISLVLEVKKKTTNREPRDCDRAQVSTLSPTTWLRFWGLIEMRNEAGL